MELSPEKKWEQATIANNFIFYKVMRHNPDVCKELLEILLEMEIVEQQEDSEKDTENNMIVTLVLESGKYRKIIEAIREREKDLYAEKRVEIRHKLAEKSKRQRLAEKYIQTDKAELAGLLELPIQVEEDGCFIGPNVVIGAGCEIKSGTRIKNSVILQNCVVNNNCFIENSIIG